MQWQTVYVFISSTFNDMHAERDHLVKRVFPELRRWCAQRKLKLMDIDLRWGVSEADALENKRVVEVCLRNIDRCRPFFLCFLGQRRGWVPGPEDVNPATVQAFPGLQSYLGKTSVTELEILHALLQPLDGHSDPVRHARFYFRDSSYLKDVSSEHRKLFCPRKSLLSSQDRDLENFKKQLSREHTTVTYRAKWNPALPSPELSGALGMGRLEDFRVEGSTLEADVLTWLQEQIALQFPSHMTIDPPEGSLEQELERQDTQLFQAYDGYIPRPAEEEAIHRLLEAPDHRPLVLLSEAGCGKTSLLAHLIHRYRPVRRVYYRFVGTTPHSFHLEKLSASLVRQWIADGLLSESEGNYTESEMRLAFSHLLTTAAAKEPFLLILDGMDQLLGQDNWLQWLPAQLPEESDVLVSLRSGSGPVPEAYRIHHLGLMTDPADKAQMVRSYMSAFLKDVDNAQLQCILQMPGSSNPLFMKIVLNELRQHGSFDTLFEMLRRDYGATPLDAFRQVLVRVSRELTDLGYSSDAPIVFLGCLACAQAGMDGRMIADAASCVQGWEHCTRQQLMDTVYALARELAPFLVLDGDRIAIRYDSLRRAILQDYSPQLLELVHTMLCVAFCEKASRDHSAEDYRLCVYHLVRSTENLIGAFFRSIPALFACIRLCGTQLLADACSDISRRGINYVNLEKVLRKAAARLDTHPETLFTELRRYADPSDPVIAGMLEQEAQQQLQYLQPLSPPGLQGLVLAEYALPDKLQDVVYTAPWLLVLQRDRLKVVDIQSHKTLNILYLEKDTDHCRYHVTADSQTAFLSRWDHNSNLLGWTQYALPALEVLSEGNGCATEGTLWQLQAAEGKLFGLFQKHQTNGGVDACLIDLSDARVLFSHTSAGSCSVCFTEGMALIHDMHSGEFWLLRTTDGAVLLLDSFLGNCHSTTGHILDGGANIYIAREQAVYLWLSGARIENGSLQQLVQLRKYQLQGDRLELVSSTEPKASCSKLHALPGGYLITESSGRLAVLNAQLQVLGFQDLGGTISTSEQWSGQFLRTGEDTLAVCYENKLQFYPLSEFLSSLQPHSRDAGHTTYPAFIRDGQYHVLAPYMRRTRLDTLETQEEPSKHLQFIMSYPVWNVHRTPIMAGTGYAAGTFSIKDTEKMELWLRRSVNDQTSRLLHAFTFQHEEEDGTVDTWAGLVVADLPPVRRMFLGKERNFVRCHLRTQSVINLAIGRPWKHTELELEMGLDNTLTALPAFIASQKDGILVFPNVYVDDSRVAVQVYDIATGSFIYATQVTPSYTLMSSMDLQYHEGGFLLAIPSREQPRFLHMDLQARKVYTGNRKGGLVAVEPFATHAFFHNGSSHELECYNLSTHTLEKVIALENAPRYSLQQALLLDGWLILRYLLSDTLEVYDYHSGKFLFRQRLESVAEALTADPQTKMLCMQDTAQRTTFFQAKQQP